MPFTFVEIEERKTSTLTLLFIFLAGLYLTSVVALMCGAWMFLGVTSRLSGWGVLTVIGGALLMAACHWIGSTARLVDRVLVTIRANPLDPDDTYHNRLKHIVEEVSVATGGRYRIEPFVIATTAMNACAVSDFNGRAAIVVTEGSLARLNRSQLEAVVGHEAAHIARGDSLSNGVFCGLFGVHEEGLKRLSGLFEGRTGTDLLRGRLGLFMIFVFVLLWLTKTAKQLCELLISREQEYRADAVAVRLTRDPLSLAEALQDLSTHWRGVGAEGEALSTIFIMDPGEEYLSEREGLIAELFSTHPPTHRRIEALLGMAHISPEAFEREMASQAHREPPRQLVEEHALIAQDDTSTRWFFWLNGSWQGPWTLQEFVARQDVTPETWVRREGEERTLPAYQDPQLLKTLRIRYNPGNSVQPAAGECPNCHIHLTQLLYEGVPLDQCPACHGCYVTPSQMSRIFAREEYDFPESIKRLAKSLPAVRSSQRIIRKFNTLPSNRLPDRRCPSCGAAVLRKFYTEAYLVEVEQCWACGLTWLDQGELELLQYLYEETEERR